MKHSIGSYPRVRVQDDGRQAVSQAGAVLLVENVPGGKLMDLSNRDPRAAEPTMIRLAESLAMMRDYRARAFGKVALIDGGGTSRWVSCEQAALAFALRCLAEATARDHRIADAHDQLEERLRQLTAAIRPRAEYSVVHGELGLDHVMIDRGGHPVVIDIENLLYFDVEWEHAVPRLRHTDSQ